MVVSLTQSDTPESLNSQQNWSLQDFKIYQIWNKYDRWQTIAWGIDPQIKGHADS
mgnify:CR=1 FL=1